MAWATLNDAREMWTESRTIPDATLARLLADAEWQCEQIAPLVAPGATVPGAYARAVVLQARELAQAARRDGDMIALDSWSVRATPVTPTVKSILRPKRLPYFGGPRGA